MAVFTGWRTIGGSLDPLGAAIAWLAVLGPFAWALAVGIAETRKAHRQALPKGTDVAAIAFSAPMPAGCVIALLALAGRAVIGGT